MPGAALTQGAAISNRVRFQYNAAISESGDSKGQGRCQAGRVEVSGSCQGRDRPDRQVHALVIWRALAASFPNDGVTREPHDVCNSVIERQVRA